MINSYQKKYGGKATGLLRLTKIGANVPPWFGIPVNYFHSFIGNKELKKIKKKFVQINGNSSKISGFSKYVRELIFNTPMHTRLQVKIIKKYHKLIRNSRTFSSGLAVRSSMIGEDGEKSSFAGMLESFLYIKDNESLINCIKSCWASAFSERSLNYRIKTNNFNKLPAIGVIVQQMIPAEKAGVVFTMDPNCEKSGIFISAVNGTSENLVTGKKDGETYLVNNEDVLGDKFKVLSKKQCILLAKIGSELEENFGYGLDIEWAIHKGVSYILQARPIVMSKEITILDNSNIIESYYGVTTPLTFSVARYAYQEVYRQFCEIAGVSSDEIRENKNIFQDMIVLVHGRVYYNLTNWYRLLQLLPSPDKSSGFMENMMGVKVRLPIRKNNSTGFFLMIKLWLMTLKNWITIDSQVNFFMKKFALLYEKYEKHEIKELNEKELISLYKNIKEEVIDSWRAPIVNDFLAMVMYGLLKKMTINWLDDKDGSLYGGLLVGDNDIVSVQPAYKISRLAQLVNSSEEYTELFKSSNKQILKKLGNDEYAILADEFYEFIRDYGYRCPGELKLEEKSYKDNPSQVIELIKSYLDLPLIERNSNNVNLGEKIGHKVKKLLRTQNFIRRQEFLTVVKLARKYMRHRENMRICRTKIFGVLREIFNALGTLMAQRRIISKPRDIFFLSEGEIIGIIADSKSIKDVKKIILDRKKEFAIHRKEENPPDRIIVKNNDYSESIISTAKTNVLTGIGCSPGIVTGVTKIVRSPNDTKINKEIIVAERTDPGWVVVYPFCTGLLVERGSILSHSAIIARELGIPTIMGIPGLMHNIKNGQKIRMNGSKGIIEILKK